MSNIGTFWKRNNRVISGIAIGAIAIYSIQYTRGLIAPLMEMPLFFGVTVGTVIGAVALYSAWQILDRRL